MTLFKLLVQTKGGSNPPTPEHMWKEWHTIEAHSASAAIRNAYLKAPAEDVLAVVAVPERSWKPTAIRTETTTRVVLGDAEKPGEVA